MRNKVISIIAVLIVYLGVFFWVMANLPVPPMGAYSTSQIWAHIIVISFATGGFIAGSAYTITWLLKE